MPTELRVMAELVELVELTMLVETAALPAAGGRVNPAAMRTTHMDLPNAGQGAHLKEKNAMRNQQHTRADDCT